MEKLAAADPRRRATRPRRAAGVRERGVAPASGAGVVVARRRRRAASPSGTRGDGSPRRGLRRRELSPVLPLSPRAIPAPAGNRPRGLAAARGLARPGPARPAPPGRRRLLEEEQAAPPPAGARGAPPPASGGRELAGPTCPPRRHGARGSAATAPLRAPRGAGRGGELGPPPGPGGRPPAPSPSAAAAPAAAAAAAAALGFGLRRLRIAAAREQPAGSRSPSSNHRRSPSGSRSPSSSGGSPSSRGGGPLLLQPRAGGFDRGGRSQALRAGVVDYDTRSHITRSRYYSC